MPFNGVTYLCCENCGSFVVEGEAEAHEQGCRGALHPHAHNEATTSHFLVMVFEGRVPMLLGPMSVEMRAQCLTDLRTRYTHCVLHTLDVSADSAGKVAAEVQRCEK